MMERQPREGPALRRRRWSARRRAFGGVMAVDFRGHKLFPTGFNSPTRFEGDVYDCEVWGEIPSDIEGTFYRMQCDFDYRPPKNEWMTGFNGDGHISSMRFANGSVDY